ncbi:MAG: lipopolysaccharide biosynthesis protein [Acidobacteria bacterium]|nr:lipopolysaccharide biosynthesis protein [Acidobacteriota bacterium]MBI3661930.1 lipopolysaccharide biosynthesis protein [Acidobacteriota bacterium]
MPRALTTQAGMLTASRALGQVLNALVGFLIVRALTQYDYGTYRQVLLLYTTLYLIGDMAFAQSLYFFVPREREKARAFLGQALVAVLALSAAWSAGIMLLAGPIAAFFGNPALAAHMALLSALLSLNLLTKIPEVGLVTLKRIGASSLNITVFESLKFVMVVAVLKWHASIDSILAAMILATALRMAALLVQMRDTAWFSLTPRLGEQFRYSMSLWLPGLLNNAGIYAHQYIVGYYFNPEQYAIYAVACFQIPLIGVVTSSVNEVFLVRATEFRSQERFDDLYRLYQNACRKVLMILVPAAVAFAALSRPLIELLFTKRYLASAPLFVLIVLALPLSGLLQDGIFRACAAMRAYSLFYMMRVALALGLGVIGARWFGLWGAAVSPLLALLTLNIAQLHKVRELLRVSFARVLPWKEMAKISLASAAAALPAMACARLFSRAWMALGAGLVVFGIVYAALALFLAVIHPEERRAILDAVRAGFCRLGLMSERTAQP